LREQTHGVFLSVAVQAREHDSRWHHRSLRTLASQRIMNSRMNGSAHAAAGLLRRDRSFALKEEQLLRGLGSTPGSICRSSRSFSTLFKSKPRSAPIAPAARIENPISSIAVDELRRKRRRSASMGSSRQSGSLLDKFKKKSAALTPRCVITFTVLRKSRCDLCHR